MLKPVLNYESPKPINVFMSIGEGAGTAYNGCKCGTSGNTGTGKSCHCGNSGSFGRPCTCTSTSRNF